MSSRKRCLCPARRGAAYIVALLLLLVFTVIGVSMASIANMGLQQCDNARHVLEARLAAESTHTSVTV